MSPPGRPKGEYRRAQPEGTPVSPTDIPAYMAHVGVAARAAATAMAAASTAAKNEALRRLAARLRADVEPLQQANATDLEAARANGLAGPLLDRLKLTPQIIETVGCCRAVRVDWPARRAGATRAH